MKRLVKEIKRLMRILHGMKAETGYLWMLRRSRMQFAGIL
jgi:hypothetical protein